ncbi:MAG: metal-dependent hydrolase [Acidimicrobiia bacterium]
MRVRQPTIDFSLVQPRWTKNGEFAQSFNALSTVPAYIEPYLITVMRRGREALGDGPGDEELRDDVEVFVRQEAQHFKLHRAYNNRLREAGGYDGMKPLEERYDADYDRFLAKRSLRFNLGYSEGFEAIGAAGAEFWVDYAEMVLKDVDPATHELWRWHLAEEYEHRTVVHRLYHRLYGHGPRSYVTRVATFLFAVVHIEAHTTRVMRYLVRADQAAMTPDEREASAKRAKEVTRNRRKNLWSVVKRVVRPGYDPGLLPPPKRLAAVLDAY